MSRYHIQTYLQNAIRFHARRIFTFAVFSQKSISHTDVFDVFTAFIHITYWRKRFAIEKQWCRMWRMCTLSCISHIFRYHILMYKFRYKLKQLIEVLINKNALNTIFRRLFRQNYIMCWLFYSMFYVWRWNIAADFQSCFSRNVYFTDISVCDVADKLGHWTIFQNCLG